MFKLLLLGSTGDDVLKWQTFLRGRSLSTDVQVTLTGTFDPITEQATKLFQQRNHLDIDGKVGLKTLSAAIALGFNVGIDDGNDETGPNWPSKPVNVKQLSPQEREALFGTFQFISAPVPGNPEAIKIIDDWVKKNIKTVTIPQLKGLPGCKTGIVEFHVKACDQLVTMFDAWEKAGLKDRLLSFGGSFVPRFIRGSTTTLSGHSFGTAFDINVPWNGLGTHGALKGEKGCVRDLVGIAVDHGFFWGHWFSRNDPMHFEAFKIV